MSVRWVLMVLLAGISRSYGDLKWESKTIKLNAEPFQSHATAGFFFQNTGSDTIVIEKVQASCSCASAVIGKKTVDPGEQGSVTATFYFGGREGIQRKRFVVSSSGGQKDILCLTVEVPRTYQAAEKRLIWRSAQSRESKSCRFINASSLPVRMTLAYSSNPAFSAEIKEIRPGFEYEVFVKPAEQDGAARAIIAVETESVNGDKPGIYKIYAVRY